MNTLTDTHTTADGAPVTHPAWCDPARCTVEPDLPLDDALHLSRVIELDATISTAGSICADAWLHQRAAGDEVYLVVDVPGAGRALFPLTGAAAAAAELAGLLQQATPTRTDEKKGEQA